MVRVAHRRDAGFTLLELLIVVAIIGVMSALLIGVSSRTYGANAKNVTQQIAATLNSARLRSVATRRIHRAYIKPHEIQVWASDTPGLKDDNNVNDDGFVERVTFPTGVTIYDVNAAVLGTGNTATENTSLSYEMKFKPDGTAGGGTIFVTDADGRAFRVLVYRATGSVYARENW